MKDPLTRLFPLRKGNSYGEICLTLQRRGYAGDRGRTGRSHASLGAWFGALGSALVDGGNPFTGQANSIATDGSVSAGAGGSAASGYSIIQADSLDAATILAKGCPVLQGGAQITVLETFEVM